MDRCRGVRIPQTLTAAVRPAPAHTTQRTLVEWPSDLGEKEQVRQLSDKVIGYNPQINAD